MGKRDKRYHGAAQYSASSLWAVLCGVFVISMILYFMKKSTNGEKMSPQERHTEALRMKTKSPYYIGVPSQIVRNIHVIPSGRSASSLQSSFYELSRRGASQAINMYSESHESSTDRDLFYIASSNIFSESFFSDVGESEGITFDSSFLVEHGIERSNIYAGGAYGGQDIISLMHNMRNFIESKTTCRTAIFWLCMLAMTSLYLSMKSAQSMRRESII